MSLLDALSDNHRRRRFRRKHKAPKPTTLMNIERNLYGLFHDHLRGPRSFKPLDHIHMWIDVPRQNYRVIIKTR